MIPRILLGHLFGTVGTKAAEGSKASKMGSATPAYVGTSSVLISALPRCQIVNQCREPRNPEGDVTFCDILFMSIR